MAGVAASAFPAALSVPVLSDLRGVTITEGTHDR
jgi:hypothetical protein